MLQEICNYFSDQYDQPVNDWDSITGAIGGPCNGHLSLSQVRLVEVLVVGQMKSLPWLKQTWAVSPG